MDHDDFYDEDHGFDIDGLYGFDDEETVDPAEVRRGLALGKCSRRLFSPPMLPTTAHWRTPYQRA